MAAAKHRKRIIIASTSEIYGKNPKQPLNELDDRVIGAPQKLRWSYSDAKALEESLASALYLNQGLPVTIIRYFNTVGPRQSHHYGMVLPRFVRNAIEGSQIPVHGNGLQSRVFCHVDDAVEATLRIAESADSIGGVFNVGGMEEISILNLAKKTVEITRSNSEIVFIKYADAYAQGFEDMDRRVPDLSKNSAQNGWQPRKTLSTIIQDIESSIKIH
jgi:UDP-glucose 4-epimerase